MEDLENKKQYKFRVIASNKLGASDPAVYPKVILAKDPWGELGLSDLCWRGKESPVCEGHFPVEEIRSIRQERLNYTYLCTYT